MKGTRNSLLSLRVLLAAGRSLNFTRTAEELHITQSAVSKHVQAVEERLGLTLFRRTSTGLRLTYAGALYIEKIAAAMRLIDEADAMVAHPDARVNLNIAVAPSFAQYCLIPHLGEFFDQHPGIRINIRPRLVTGRDRTERFDAEIQLNTGHAAGMTSQYLCGREMGLVAAPGLLERHPITNVDDVEGLPMLKRAQRGYGWDEWLAEIAPGRSPPGVQAPEFEGFSLLLPAVLHGLGVAIVPLCLVQSYLYCGELVRPLGDEVQSRYAYHLMVPRPSQSGPQLELFCAWLIEMADGLRPAAAQ